MAAACTRCGAALNARVPFCPACGADLPRDEPRAPIATPTTIAWRDNEDRGLVVWPLEPSAKALFEGPSTPLPLDMSRAVTASVVRRVGAFLCDTLGLTVVTLALLCAAFYLWAIPGLACEGCVPPLTHPFVLGCLIVAGTLAVAALIGPIVYFAVCWRGDQTWGEAFAGTRVVATSGEPLGRSRRWPRAGIVGLTTLGSAPALISGYVSIHMLDDRLTAWHALVAFGPCLPLLLSSLPALWDQRRRTLHDRLAGSVVVRTGVGAKEQP